MNESEDFLCNCSCFAVVVCLSLRNDSILTVKAVYIPQNHFFSHGHSANTHTHWTGTAATRVTGFWPSASHGWLLQSAPAAGCGHMMRDHMDSFHHRYTKICHKVGKGTFWLKQWQKTKTHQNSFLAGWALKKKKPCQNSFLALNELRQTKKIPIF